MSANSTSEDSKLTARDRTRILKILEKHGAEDPDFCARSLTHAGVNFRSLKRLREAEPLLKRGAQISLSLGRDHLDVTHWALEELALNSQALGDNDDFIWSVNQQKAIFDQQFGSNSPQSRSCIQRLKNHEVNSL